MSNRKHRKTMKPSTRAKAEKIAAELHARDLVALRAPFGSIRLSATYRHLNRNR